MLVAYFKNFETKNTRNGTYSFFFLANCKVAGITLARRSALFFVRLNLT